MIMREGIRINKKNDKIIMNHIFHNESKYSYPYFAGWADGDGHFSPKNNANCYILRIRNEEPVYQLSDLFKTAVLLSTPEKRAWLNESDPRKSTELNGHRFIHFCKKVAPFLIDKQKEVFTALKNKGVYDFMCDHMNHTKEEFTAYLAGILEAEGHFRYNESEYNYFISMNNYSKLLMEFIVNNIKKYFDVDVNLYTSKLGKENNINIMKNKFFPKNKVYTFNADENYSFQISGKKSVPILKKILPYMLIDYKIDAASKILARFDDKN